MHRFWRTARFLGPVLGGLLLGGGAASAEPPKVVVDIQPVHSLVSGVMAGVGDPTLIVKGGASPHFYALRPSDARALEDANLVFWVGPALDGFLTRPLANLAGDATVVTLLDEPSLLRLEAREGGAWEAHHHGEHEEEHGDGHDHDAAHKDGDHDHDAAHKDGDHEAAHKDGDHDAKSEEHAEAHEHEHDETDPHVWLDPENARAIVRLAVSELSAADPANAERYAANGAAMEERLDALRAELAAELAPAGDHPYVVFHDAYQYFENRFGTRAIGSISVGDARQPGARRIAEIRAKIKDLGARCVFAEPQFEPALVKTVTDGTDARSGVLDPLGATLEPGPDAYFAVMRDLARNLTDCLAPAS